MVRETVGDTWYSVDLIIDWGEQLVSIYINQSPYTVQPFFVMRATEVDSANALGLYSLSPGGTSMFRNL